MNFSQLTTKAREFLNKNRGTVGKGIDGAAREVQKRVKPEHQGKVRKFADSAQKAVGNRGNTPPQAPR